LINSQDQASRLIMAETEYQIETDRVTAADWSAGLDRFEDASIYQTWAYGEVRWGRQEVSHLLLKHRSETIAMAQLRIVRPRHVRAGMAHLRWGPLCHLKGRDLDPEIVRRMADALDDEYVRKRGLFLRVLPNAHLDTPRAQVFQSAFCRYQSEPFDSGDSYRTLVLDLTPPLEIIRRKLDQKWRNQLNRAEKNGLTIKEGTGADHFREFIRVYEDMWARKQFALASDIREFERMQESLPRSQQLKVILCEHAGAPAAGLIGTAIGNTGIYLFGATNEQGMKSKASYLVQWRMIQWLKEDGIRHYNLGGINPEKNPGVYHFKQGLSGQDVLYLQPFVACNNVASRVFARAAGLARGRIRKVMNRFLQGARAR
jgi:lipid II:glycine glycyltransferase (peptidoglycan interpeptide bridge formation enzyme)